MKKVLLAALLVVVAVAAAGYYKFNVLTDDLYLTPSRETLAGSWLAVEPIPGGNLHAGFELRADGSAAAINTAGLRYKSWSFVGERLTFQEISIDNGTISQKPFAYRVLSLSIDGYELVLITDDGDVAKFRREDPDQKAMNRRFEAE